ncbi:MAG TPA: hypothetical protein VNX22_09365 [Acidobacteriaceae bacterium]|nr:hypothetical protein [Acidobacteriaceae bacterium]
MRLEYESTLNSLAESICSLNGEERTTSDRHNATGPDTARSGSVFREDKTSHILIALS